MNHTYIIDSWELYSAKNALLLACSDGEIYKKSVLCVFFVMTSIDKWGYIGRKCRSIDHIVSAHKLEYHLTEPSHFKGDCSYRVKDQTF